VPGEVRESLAIADADADGHSDLVAGAPLTSGAGLGAARARNDGHLLHVLARGSATPSARPVTSTRTPR
jgi:hypothetical protein